MDCRLLLFSVAVFILLFALVAGQLSDPPKSPVYQIDATSSADIVHEINKVRALSGLAPLLECHNLDQVATNFILDQYQRQFFSHTNPDGATPLDRARAGGYGNASAVSVSELLAYDKQTPSAVVSAWVQNASNLKSIKNPLATHIGAAGIVGSVAAWRAAGYQNWNRVPYWCAVIASGGTCLMRPLSPPTSSFVGIPACSGNACTVLGTMENSVPPAYTS